MKGNFHGQIRKDEPTDGELFLSLSICHKFFKIMKNIIRWVLGIFFLLGALSFLILKIFVVSFLWFLLMVLTLPPYDNKLKLSNKLKFIAGIVIFFVSMSVYSQSNEYKRISSIQEYNKTHPTVTNVPTANPTPTDKPTPTNNQTITKSVTKTPTNTSVPKPTITVRKEPLLKDEVKKIVISLSYPAMSKNDLKEIKINDDIPNDVYVLLSYKPEAWDEKQAVRLTADTLVTASEKLFNNPIITRVWVTTLGNFTDQYGKSYEAVAVRFGLNKETAQKINWKEFKDMVFVDYNALLRIADEKYISPSILNKLN